MEGAQRDNSVVAAEIPNEDPNHPSTQQGSPTPQSFNISSSVMSNAAQRSKSTSIVVLTLLTLSGKDWLILRTRHTNPPQCHDICSQVQQIIFWAVHWRNWTATIQKDGSAQESQISCRALSFVFKDCFIIYLFFKHLYNFLSDLSPVLFGLLCCCLFN